MLKAKRIGIDDYNAGQDEKAALLELLLSEYNDGKQKTLYCLAVNLLEADVVKEIIKASEARSDQTLKEKAANMASQLRKAAEERQTELTLRKKPKK